MHRPFMYSCFLSRLNVLWGKSCIAYYQLSKPFCKECGPTVADFSCRCKKQIEGTKQLNHYQSDPWSMQFSHFCTSSSASFRHSSSKEHRDCWNCGRDTSPVRELFFCDCGVVQKPANELTFFDLMVLEPSFDINSKKLSEIFHETQKKLHPDKFSSKSETERKLAEDQSSLLNKAYNTLQKPLSRAIYLLELQGISISEESQFNDPEFLMEIMDFNELISKAENPSSVAEVETLNNNKIHATIQKLSKLFHAKKYTEAKNATIHLRYYTTIQERINELKRSKLG
ncbi:unnamed protein product [Lymnaea stagnalis]|uniref:J domain-containing protein n=1 Tax=Lymnaea stagnalis TaxID=6523 RepID=A0AAV2HKE8_LYMST